MKPFYSHYIEISVKDMSFIAIVENTGDLEGRYVMKETQFKQTY